MVRWLSAATAGLAVLSIASLAHAQRAAGSFGDQGEFIVSADRLFPLIGYTHTSAVQFGGGGGIPNATKVVNHGDTSSLGFFWGGTDTLPTDTGADMQNPYTVPRVGFDYTIVPNVTIGGDLVVYFTLGSTQSAEADLNNGGTQTTTLQAPKSTIFGVAPRAGYILHFSELISLWLRGGLSYYTMTQHTNPANGETDSNNFDQLSLDLGSPAHDHAAAAPRLHHRRHERHPAHRGSLAHPERGRRLDERLRACVALLHRREPGNVRLVLGAVTDFAAAPAPAPTPRLGRDVHQPSPAGAGEGHAPSASGTSPSICPPPLLR